MTRWNDLEAQADKILIDNLPAGLKAAINELRAKGATDAAILARCRAVVARDHAGTQKGQLTLLAVEAYLEKGGKP